MQKILFFTFLFSSLLMATPSTFNCKHRFPSGIKAWTVDFGLTLQDDKSFTAAINILDEQDRLVAQEVIVDLLCSFSSTETMVSRCHYQNTNSFALATDLITTISREFFFGANEEIIGGTDVQKKEISLTMDVVKNGVYIPYGYGDIIFNPKECKIK